MREASSWPVGASALALIALGAAPAAATAHHHCPHGQHCATTHPPPVAPVAGGVKGGHQVNDGGHVKT